MSHTRREFLRVVGHGGVAMAIGSFLPSLFGRRLLAEEEAGRGPSGGAAGRALVVLQLTGGNDGLNTVIPFGADPYRRGRPTLAVPASSVLRLDDEFGLHPALAALKELYDDGLVAIVHGAGYPKPDRSHFRSMEIWHTARPEAGEGIERTGWLGRYLDGCEAARAGRLPAIAIGREVPHALASARVAVPAVDDPARFGYETAGEEGRLLKALLACTCEAHAAGGSCAPAAAAGAGAAADPLAAVREAARGALLTAEDMHRLGQGYEAAYAYPETALGAGFKRIAQMLADGKFGTRVFYLTMNGYDTHAGQDGPHRDLLQQLGAALRAFFKDLRGHELDEGVLVLAFSEFGRRVAENASAGTDHGAAGPVFLAGPGVRPGLHGAHPRFDALVDGDLAFTCDFRRLYATALEGWLGFDSTRVLGARFEPLPVLRP